MLNYFPWLFIKNRDFKCPKSIEVHIPRPFKYWERFFFFFKSKYIKRIIKTSFKKVRLLEGVGKFACYSNLYNRDIQNVFLFMLFPRIQKRVTFVLQRNRPVSCCNECPQEQAISWSSGFMWTSAIIWNRLTIYDHTPIAEVIAWACPIWTS